ncbi:hypothetical protein AB205_0158040 [Aquarana catesbeiana]|uniref:Uncharacterized protein n=1 Tax=Aquarana catesbeiana TaxID=8400 RepID=A0A2G9S2K6_AQUCT|nr:hypothetical protein AB205_0158040 [Aquarana catesbeiana]
MDRKRVLKKANCNLHRCEPGFTLNCSSTCTEAVFGALEFQAKEEFSFSPDPPVWTVLIGPVLITCTLPRKKKKLSSNTHQTEHVQPVPWLCKYQVIFWRQWKNGRIREMGSNSLYTQGKGLTP